MATIWVLQVFSVLLVIKAVLIANASIALPGCSETCGDLFIPYPFGTDSNCAFNESFVIRCDKSSNKTYLGNTTLEVLGIALTCQVRVNSSVISRNCNFTNSNSPKGVDLSATPFMFSGDRNRFTATGCDNYAIIVDSKRGTIGGCLSMCDSSLNGSVDSSGSGDCNGLNCCQIIIPPGINSFEATMANVLGSSDTSLINGCMSSFMVQQSWFSEQLTLYGSDVGSRMEYVPAVLDWGMYQGRCELSTTESAVFSNVQGYYWGNLSDTHLCVCNKNYYDYYYSSYTEYITDGGCHGRECLKRFKDARNCRLLCMYTPGSSDCTSCPYGYSNYSDQINSSDGIFCYSSYDDVSNKSKVKLS